MSQNNHLIGVWMPGSFIEQRERGNEELKSKGRIDSEMWWGIKWKGLQSGETSPRECPASEGVCESLLFTGGQGQTSLHELNKGTLAYSQAEGQGPPGKPLGLLIIIKASQRNSFQHGVRIGFLPATRGLQSSPRLPRLERPRQPKMSWKKKF